jgi:hypothetical protein
MSNIIRRLIVVVIIIFSFISIQAQRGSGVYEYPIKPGTLEWKALTSHYQMQKVCQIPEAILIFPPKSIQ